MRTCILRGFLTAAVVALVAGLAVADDQPAEKSGEKTDSPSAGTSTKAGTDGTKADTKTTANSDKPRSSKGRTEKATFGGGCFWSMEAVFERVPGVKSVESGFSGGTVPSPSYDMVCTGMTGHAEVIQVTYDPDLVPYERLLTVFWSAHDPTTLNAQGDDFGTQYRSVIFYHSEDQKKAAQKLYRELTTRRVFRSRIVTDLVPFETFYPAEPYHQDYFRNHPYSEYTQMYIIPKLRKLRPKLKLR